MSRTLDSLALILCDALGVQPGAVKPEARLDQDLGVDHLAGVDVMLRVEDNFGIEFTDGDIQTLSTVADLVALIERKRACAQ